MTTALLKPLSALALAMAFAAPAHASITSASSDGYGLYAGASLLGAPLVDLKLMGDANRTNTATPPAEPIPYDESKGLTIGAQVGISAKNLGSLGATVKSGTLTGQAVWDTAVPNKYDYTDTAAGLGGVENLGLNVGSTLLGLFTGISLTAGVLSSESTVTGDYATWATTADSTILDANLILKSANIVIGSLDLDALARAHSDPNTSVNDYFGLLTTLGIYLTLNEQTKNCGDSSCSMETNALHLWADPLNIGLAGLDIKIGHSFAELKAVDNPAAVPLPGTWAMMLGGLGVLGTFARRRKQTA